MVEESAAARRQVRGQSALEGKETGRFNLLHKRMLRVQWRSVRQYICLTKLTWERSEGEAMPKNAYGCVFCISGREQEVAERIQRVCPEVRATAVFQEKYKSVCGKKSRIKAVIMPGYVFFEAPDDAGIVSHFPTIDIIRVLKGNDHDWQLTGNDDEFARWLFSYQGCLKFSTAYREGDRIRIISGPLKDMEGMITRVDRRGRSGQVTIKFNNRDVKLWLGFDLVDTLPNTNGRCHSEKKSE